jgi:hypothetical protein
MEANALMKDLEPTTPQEYILKGVVNAALGQEQGIVRFYLIMKLRTLYHLSQYLSQPTTLPVQCSRNVSACN